MAYDSYVQYNGDGAETDFSVTFNYLSQTVVLPPSTPAGIKVYVSDVQQTSGYTLTGSNIVFTTPPASGTNNVVIKRVTPRGHGDRLVNFAEGATLSAADLETAQLQNLYIAQEAWEQGSEDSVVTVSTTSIDAGSITATELDADCVGASELADNSVALANMTDDSVSTAESGDDSITFAKLKETDFVSGSFTASTDTFLRFDRSTHNIVDPLSEDSQVKVADISDFNSTVNAKALSDFTGTIASAGIPMGDKKITGLATPTASTDAATKGYVDDFGSALRVSPEITGSFSGTQIYRDDDDDFLGSGSLPADTKYITAAFWEISITSLVETLSGNEQIDIVAYLQLFDGTTATNIDSFKFAESGSTGGGALLYVWSVEDAAFENSQAGGYAYPETSVRRSVTSPYWPKGDNTTIRIWIDVQNVAEADTGDYATMSATSKINFTYIGT